MLASLRNISIGAADVEAAIAWKNGLFDFRVTPLSIIMQEIQRNYADIEEVVFENVIDEKFTATIPRNVALSTALNILRKPNGFSLK